MKEFWKDELDLFKKDIENFWDFMFQPVTFGKKETVLSLKPDNEEIIAKAEAIANKDESVAGMDSQTENFWNNEFNSLKNDVENFWDFLFKPVTFGKK